MTRWVFDFAEGSREMRELLGGKGAGLAEMTRILGPDLVPNGFTVTTEACVAYMRAGRTTPAGLDDQLDAALAAPQRQKPAPYFATSPGGATTMAAATQGGWILTEPEGPER